MRLSKKWLSLAAGALSLSLVMAGCSESDKKDEAAAPAPGAAKPALTLYNAQNEEMLKEMTDAFTKETGIVVNYRNGDDFELANQIIQEGAASPADVFVTENSPAMTLVDSKNGFAKLDADTLSQVPAQYNSPNGNWGGFAARSTVLVYNSKQLQKNALPTSLLDLAKPEWKDKVGFSPGGADFQAIVSAVLATKGEAATTQWLAGLKQNGKVYRGNSAVMKAVNAGEIPAGVIYHYYWYKDRAEASANSANAELHNFAPQDPGAFVSVSGAGVVKSSKYPAEAQQFVKFLNGPKGQDVLAKSKALEYPIGNGVTNPKLKPLAELGAPPVDVSTLNGPKVVELMQKAGLL